MCLCVLTCTHNSHTHTCAHPWSDCFGKMLGMPKWDTSQTLEILHLWQFFCPQPELHHTPGREGTTQLLKIGSYCCMLLHSPHSGCHCDSILGSHLAGMVSKTCSQGEGGSDKGRSEKYTRAISKVDCTCYPCLHLHLMLQPAFQQLLKAWAETPMMRCWSPAPYSHMVYSPEVEICKETFLSEAHQDRK